MKIRSLILIGLLAGFFFAVALFPANLFWKLVGNQLPIPLEVERVGGTLWDGFLVGNMAQPVPGPAVVRWRLYGFRLLIGEVAVNLAVEGAQYRFAGGGYWGLWGKGLQEFSGDAQAALLDSALVEFSATVDGVLNLNDVSVKIAGNRISSGSGVISWSGGPVTVQDGDHSQSVDFPGVRGELAAVDGNLIINVHETQGNMPLGELSLLPAEGLVGIKVLKRVMALAGYGAQGDEDNVLLNLQQPLPF